MWVKLQHILHRQKLNVSDHPGALGASTRFEIVPGRLTYCILHPGVLAPTTHLLHSTSWWNGSHDPPTSFYNLVCWLLLFTLKLSLVDAPTSFYNLVCWLPLFTLKLSLVDAPTSFYILVLWLLLFALELSPVVLRTAFYIFAQHNRLTCDAASS